MVAVCIGLSGPARADSASQAIDLLDQGSEAYERGDFAHARELFGKARDLVPEKANPYRWLGLANARAGRCSEALVDFEVFLKRVPAGDPRTFEVLKTQSACHLKVADILGTVVLRTQPDGAEIRIDDRGLPSLGTTPAARELAEGAHLLMLRKPGYVEVTREVLVNRHELVEVSMVLQRAAEAPAMAAMAASPEQATPAPAAAEPPPPVASAAPETTTSTTAAAATTTERPQDPFAAPEAQAATGAERKTETAATGDAAAAPSPIYKKWWLWTGVAVVLVGAGVGLGVGLGSGGGEMTPTTPLGNFDLR